MTKKMETKKEAAFVVGYQILKSGFQLEKKKETFAGLFSHVTGNFLLLGFQSEPAKEKRGRKLASDLSPSRALIH